MEKLESKVEKVDLKIEQLKSQLPGFENCKAIITIFFVPLFIRMGGHCNRLLYGGVLGVFSPDNYRRWLQIGKIDLNKGSLFYICSHIHFDFVITH